MTIVVFDLSAATADSSCATVETLITAPDGAGSGGAGDAERAHDTHGAAAHPSMTIPYTIHLLQYIEIPCAPRDKSRVAVLVNAEDPGPGWGKAPWIQASAGLGPINFREGGV